MENEVNVLFLTLCRDAWEIVRMMRRAEKGSVAGNSFSSWQHSPSHLGLQDAVRFPLPHLRARKRRKRRAQGQLLLDMFVWIKKCKKRKKQGERKMLRG